MKEKEDEKKYLVEDITFPPQSSIELESHGKEDQRYYTWKVKVYCDDLEKAFKQVCEMNEKLRKAFGVG